MTDPLGFVSGGTPAGIPRSVRPVTEPGTGADFRSMLQAEIEQVNDLQRDASAAAEDLVTGRRDDVEAVLIATQKADNAFRLLMQVRNKMMDAYEEVKQIRF
jgi:flagellar hook-basal body complex protein FliE